MNTSVTGPAMPASPPDHLTTVLARRTAGPPRPEAKPTSSRSLLRASYAELQRLAEALVQSSRGELTIDPHALVNEAARHSLGASGLQDLTERGDYYAFLANALRRILAELAEQCRQQTGDRPRVALNLVGLQECTSLANGLSVLRKMESHSERHAQVVVLRMLGGLSNEETAEQMGLTPGRAAISLEQARHWLRRQLESR